MAARITQEVVNIRNQLKAKDEELLHSKEEGLFHYFSRLRGFAQSLFYRLSKVIQNWISFASMRSVIGPENSRNTQPVR